MKNFRKIRNCNGGTTATCVEPNTGNLMKSYGVTVINSTIEFLLFATFKTVPGPEFGLVFLFLFLFVSMAAFTVSAMSPRHMIFIVLASVVSNRSRFSLSCDPKFISRYAYTILCSSF